MSANVNFWAWLCCATIGCSHALPMPQIAYEGQRAQPRVQSGTLPRLDALSRDFELLGTTNVSCRRSRPSGTHFVVALGTLDCTEDRLASIVDEQAIAVGGTALHRFLCQRMGDTIECSANVARAGQGLASGAPSTPQRIMAMARVEFQLSKDSVLGEPLPYATELSYEPVSDRTLGRLRATVSAPGQIEEARVALFDAAAALGAAHVVAPVCAPDLGANTRSCTASVSTPRCFPRPAPGVR